jgi:hypothetical protein
MSGSVEGHNNRGRERLNAARSRRYARSSHERRWRGLSFSGPAARRWLGDHPGDVKITIGAVWNHRLAGFETHPRAIEMDRHDVRLERYKIGDAADFGIGVGIRPCHLARVSDGVIAAEALVRAKGLELYRSEGRLIDVGTLNVPTRCKAGLVKDRRPLCIGDDMALMVDHEVIREVWRMSMR